METNEILIKELNQIMFRLSQNMVSIDSNYIDIAKNMNDTEFLIFLSIQNTFENCIGQINNLYHSEL